MKYPAFLLALLLPLMLSQCISFKKPPKPDHIHPGLYPIKIGKDWGFSNENGAVTTALQYDTAGLYYYGLAVAGQKGKLGYVDRYGAWQIPAKYDEAARFYYSCTGVLKGSKQKYIDYTVKKIADCFMVTQTEMEPSKPLSPEDHSIYNGEKYALIFQSLRGNPSNQNFEAVQDTSGFVFDNVITFSSKALLVEKSGKFGCYPVSNFSPKKTHPNSESIEIEHLLSSQGDTTYSIPLIYDDYKVINILNSAGYSRQYANAHVKIGDQWGLINRTGNNILNAEYNSVHIDQYPFAWVEYSPDHFGYFNTILQKQFFAIE